MVIFVMEKLFTGNKSSPTNNKRINLFLGEPNSGKSSILEVLGLLSLTNCQEVGKL